MNIDIGINICFHSKLNITVNIKVEDFTAVNFVEETDSEVRGRVYPRLVSDGPVRDRVLVAVECTLEAGRVSADCVDSITAQVDISPEHPNLCRTCIAGCLVSNNVSEKDPLLLSRYYVRVCS